VNLKVKYNFERRVRFESSGIFARGSRDEIYKYK